jgi:N6-adenosine-specific RNA methylase IME4
MEKKYQIIYADPPWQYGNRQYQDNSRPFEKLEENQYQTMSINDLNKLPVEDITEKDSICFMWVTDSHLKEGIELLENWGFKYKTVAFVWLKKYKSGNLCVNFAPWTLKSTELCLLGIKGYMTKNKKSNNVRQLVEAIRGRHSEKPQEVRDRIVNMFGDIPKIELFAREKTEGWDVIGNDIDGKDIRETLEEMVK